jgi:hypothetical protein
MPTIVWVSGAIGTSLGVVTVASADHFPALRSQLKNWGSAMLCISAMLCGFALALVALV